MTTTADNDQLQKSVAGYIRTLEEKPPAPVSLLNDKPRLKRLMIMFGIFVGVVGLLTTIYFVMRRKANDAGVIFINCVSNKNFKCSNDAPRITLLNPFVTQSVANTYVGATPTTDQKSCVSYLLGSPPFLQLGEIPNNPDAGSQGPNRLYASLDSANIILSADPTICSQQNTNWVVPTTWQILSTYRWYFNMIRYSGIPDGWTTFGDVIYSVGAFAAVPLYWTVQGVLSDNTIVDCQTGLSGLKCVVPFGVVNANPKVSPPSGMNSSVQCWPGPMRQDVDITSTNYDLLTRLPRQGNIVAQCLMVTIENQTTVGSVLSAFGLGVYDVPYVQALNNSAAGSFFQGKLTTQLSLDVTMNPGDWFYVSGLPVGYTAPRPSVSF